MTQRWPSVAVATEAARELVVGVPVSATEIRMEFFGVLKHQGWYALNRDMVFCMVI